MKITNIRVKVPAKSFSVIVECPCCNHQSYIKVTKDIEPSRMKGQAEGTCHQCGAVYTFDWERE